MTKYTVEATVKRIKVHGVTEFDIVVRANGFEGRATSYTLGSAFTQAYEEMVSNLLAGTSGDVP